MPNTRQIARRIDTVRSLSQVTRAMYLVSASRMRKAQERALAARPYADKTWELLRHLAQSSRASADHPLLAVGPVRRMAIVLVASDRGLCAGYNNNVARAAFRYAQEQTVPVTYVTVGREARRAVLNGSGEIMGSFVDMPAELAIQDTAPIAHLVEDAFLAGEVDAVAIAYTRFINVMTQVPEVRSLLPMSAPEGTEQQVEGSERPHEFEYIYEPSPRAILDWLLPHSIEVEIFGALLESAVSEHSARMVAMRSATDNANEQAAELLRHYNRARQTSITNQILDIAGATEALATT